MPAMAVMIRPASGTRLSISRKSVPTVADSNDHPINCGSTASERPMAEVRLTGAPLIRALAAVTTTALAKALIKDTAK
jgi:hypothetical protein